MGIGVILASLIVTPLPADWVICWSKKLMMHWRALTLWMAVRSVRASATVRSAETSELMLIWGTSEPWVNPSELTSTTWSLCGAAPAHVSSRWVAGSFPLLLSGGLVV